MRSEFNNLQELIHLIVEKKISIYKALNIVRMTPKKYNVDLKKMMSQSNPYFRLFSAWAIGEIGDKNSFRFLSKFYLNEKDDNVRANIVRALFFIDPSKISYNALRRFLEDDYHTVKLIAVKFSVLCNHLYKKFCFEYYFRKIKYELVKFELLKNIVFFNYNSNSILSLLKNSLEEASSILLRVYLIQSVGKLNNPNCINILLNYYNKHRLVFKKNPLLAYVFSSAIVDLCVSRAYNELYELYCWHNNTLIKYKVIEALSSGGGPNSLLILKKIQETENNVILRNEISQQINSMKVLDI